MTGLNPSRKKKTTVNPYDSSGEEFDFDPSDSIADTMTTRSGRSRPHAAPQAARRAAPALDSEPSTGTTVAPTPPAAPTLPGIPADAAKLLAPVTTTVTTRSQAQDTNYFYLKSEIDVKGTMTMRKVCKLCW
jgi:hypothetical protein